jgi:hypothetical protein
MSIPRRIYVASVTALLIAVAAHAQAPPNLTEVIVRLRAYLSAYGEQYSATVATERYKQTSGYSNDPVFYNEATLESDFGIVHVPGVGQWLGFRDVFRVSGRTVQDRSDRLAKLFADPSATSITQAMKIVEESTRFNIGNVRRTINDPSLVLELLDPSHEFQFGFSKAGEDTQDGVHLWVLSFEEQVSPTIVKDLKGNDEPATGRVWVDPETGRLHRADIIIKNLVTGIGALRASLSVTYQEDPHLHLWVPAKMTERYEGPGIDRLEGEATYTGYRQFGVKTEEQFVPPAH